MTDDTLEFSISQYADGTLPQSERAAVDAVLNEDAGARALLAEYRRLDVALKSAPLPAVRWEILTQSISSAIDANEEEQTAQTYRMPLWVRVAAPLSLAASVLIATGVGIRMYANRHSQHQNIDLAIHQNPIDNSVVQIAIGPDAEHISGPGETQIDIGPAGGVKDEPILVQYSDDMAARPSRVSVASGVNPAHDTADPIPDMQ